MKKDRAVKSHLSKGRSTGAKNNTVEFHLKDEGVLDQYLKAADKYTDGLEETPANVRLRHPNRNVDKNNQRHASGKTTGDFKGARDNAPSGSARRSAVSPAVQQGDITKELLQRLFEHNGEVCVTAYLATHAAGAEGNERQNLIAFKSFLQNVSLQLREKGLDASRVIALLSPGYDLLKNDAFWRTQHQGLAVFIADAQFELVRMPRPPHPSIMINSKFYLAPLAPFVAPEPYFYILVLSKKQSKLFKADRHAIEYIDLPEIPNGIEDVVHLEEKDDQTLWRTGSSGGGGGANYHGIGGGKPDEKENIAMYLEAVDNTLWEQRLSKERVPLVLAGVDYLLPIYRSVTQYRNIYNHGLTGSYEHEDAQKLHERAKELLAPYFEEAGKKALMAYANQSATDLTSSDPAVIIPAAHYGRVATLFAQRDHHIWGTFDEAKNILALHPDRAEGDECLMNATVLKTLLQGGQVYFLDKDEMPADSLMAAQMRYEA